MPAEYLLPLMPIVSDPRIELGLCLDPNQLGRLLPMSLLVSFFVTVRWSLRVTIWTQKSQIVGIMSFVISVDVVDLQRQIFPVPRRTDAT